MSWIKAIWAEFIGLFVDDGAFAVAILVWLAVCWLVVPRLRLAPAWPPVLLFLGLILILAESAMRLSSSNARPHRPDSNG
jgi:hypothetical protein